LVRTEIDFGNFCRHPTVELLVRKLTTHTVIDLLGVPHLCIVIVQFVLGNVPADFPSDYLLLNLLQFRERQLALVHPLILAPLITAEYPGLIRKVVGLGSTRF